MRLQMQGLVLLSLVLVLLLLSFATDANKPSGEPGEVLSDRSLTSNVTPIHDSSPFDQDTSKHYAQAESFGVGLEDSHGAAIGDWQSEISEKHVAEASKGTVPETVDRSERYQSSDAQVDSQTNQKEDPSVAPHAIAPQVITEPSLPEAESDESKRIPMLHLSLSTQANDLSHWWGQSVGQRVAQSRLPLISVGDFMVQGSESDFDANQPESLHGLPKVERSKFEPLSGDGKTSMLYEDVDVLVDDFATIRAEGNTQQSIFLVSGSLQEIGFTNLISTEPFNGSSDSETISDHSTMQESKGSFLGNKDLSGGLAGEASVVSAYAGDRSGIEEGIYEPIVQSPYLQADSQQVDNGARPSSKIAMTQLQSPVPGTSGPLLPAAPIGPGAGPAVNFPQSPEVPTPNNSTATSDNSTSTEQKPDSSAAQDQDSQEANTDASNEGQQEQEQADGDESTQEELADDEDSDKHMISELVGSGYGWFGTVFDSGFYFANEFTFLKAKTVGTVKVGVTDMLEETTVSENTDTGLGFGNRLTLGVRGRNAGLKCQYWTFASDHVVSESWHDYRPVPRFITASSSMLETVDLEITQQHVLFGCQLESSFGGRYAEYDGQDSASLVDQLHDSLELTGLARATRHLRGAGPTLGIAGRKNLRINFGTNVGDLLPSMDCDGCGLETCTGDCESWRTAHPCFPWNLYWNGRIAWLWAEESSGTVTEATVNYDGGDGGASTARSRDKALIFDDRDSSIFTLGFQVGLEYTRPVFTRSQLLARVGFEYQHWDLGKNVAEAQSFAFLSDNTNFGGRVDALASSNRNYLKLSGFTFLVGLNY